MSLGLWKLRKLPFKARELAKSTLCSAQAYGSLPLALFILNCETLTIQISAHNQIYINISVAY